MAVVTSDLKIRQSERLTDNADGGGRMVAAIVEDGDMNNLFPDISLLDRILGRVSMRLGYLHVDTNNTDTYYGAFGFVTQPPSDPSVHITCFSTGAYGEQRLSARNRIESYVNKSVESRLFLYGEHFIGQRQITAYCLSDAPNLEVNQVIALSTEKAGYTPNIQYFRVKKLLSRVSQNFYDEQGSFSRDVITVETTTAFLYDFFGQEASRFSSVKPPTRIRLTQITDAANYFTCKPVEVDAEIGDLTIKIESPYVPLVPSNTAETPMLDNPATLGDITIIKSGEENAITGTWSLTGAADTDMVRYIGSGVARGGVHLTSTQAELVDDGAGSLVPIGSASNGGWTGEVDYATGQIILRRATSFSVSWTYAVQPGVAFNQQVFTQRIKITSLNRQLTYVSILRPFPNAGALNCDYLALGKWIRLSDDGDGNLAGVTPQQGSGTINYATGSVSVTLGTLPDVDSLLVFSWGTALRTQDRAGDTDIEPGRIQVQLANTAVVPGTLDITWLESGVTKTASDDSNGNVKIGATTVGRVLYSTGEVGFKPTHIPDDSTNVVFNYDWRLSYSDVYTLTASAGNVDLTLPEVPVLPGSLFMRYQTVDTYPYGIGVYRRNLTMTVRDDGAGNIIGLQRNGADVPVTEGPIGTIDYATGDVQWQAEQTAPGWIPSFSTTSNGRCVTVSGWTLGVLGYEFDGAVPVQVSWTKDTAADTSATETFPLPPLEFDLTPTVTEAVVPGSVRFNFRGNVYVDRFGELYKNPSATTNAAVSAGTVNYTTGTATLADYSGTGNSSAVSVKSLLTRFTETGVTALYFRTPGAPLKPSSFIMRANDLETGELLIGTADVSGVITGTRMLGKVDDRSGAVEVEFGEMVAAAGYVDAPWYNPANVVSGQIWKPTAIDPQTATFNTVIFRSVPQNASLIGLDPVRLPEDGRVLAYKEGDVVVIAHNDVVSVASPVASQVVSCGRTNLSDIEVRDTNGQPVLSIWYTINKVAGTVTFANVLDLTGYVLPIIIHHKIDEIRQVVDVQVTGEIGINSPLTKEFPAEGSFLSSAMVFGDINARYFGMFDQDTWTGVWSDLLIGNPVAAATYNNGVYPPLVLNKNAITERWAIIFQSPSTFSVSGEVSGTIATGTITADLEPINPVTGEPYFFLNKLGWGTGWAAGNVVRFNTVGALAPIWFVRTTLTGEPSTATDNFKFQIIGNAN